MFPIRISGTIAKTLQLVLDILYFRTRWLGKKFFELRELSFTVEYLGIEIIARYNIAGSIIHPKYFELGILKLKPYG